jgi:hypothetical protein
MLDLHKSTLLDIRGVKNVVKMNMHAAFKVRQDFKKYLVHIAIYFRYVARIDEKNISRREF